MVNFWGQEVKDQCQTTPQLDLETRWRHYSRPIWSTSFLILLVAKMLYWDIVYLFLLVVGRVPGDYPVPAGYCTTRHYPDPAGYYVKMCPDPSNLSNSIS